MPEGDVVRRTAAELHAALAGVPISECEIRWGRRSAPDVIGARTLEVVARGKHVLHRIEGGLTIHSHLRMEGMWRVRERHRVTERARHDRRIRALVGTDDVVALGLRLGMLDVLRTRDEPRLVGHLGPDVLGADWDPAVAVRNLAADGRPIGEALMDQRNLAGIGTVYAAESLFIEGVNPWHSSAGLPLESLVAVVDRAVVLLRDNADRPVRSTTGSRQRGQQTFVHGRLGHGCRRCATAIRVDPIGTPPNERVLYHCPHCQPAP